MVCYHVGTKKQGGKEGEQETGGFLRPGFCEPPGEQRGGGMPLGGNPWEPAKHATGAEKGARPGMWSGLGGSSHESSKTKWTIRILERKTRRKEKWEVFFPTGETTRETTRPKKCKIWPTPEYTKKPRATTKYGGG